MRTTKTLITLTTTIILLAALTTTATARNFRTSTTTSRATWTSAEFSGGFGSARCNLTIEGTLRSATITKTRGGEIGSLNAATIGTCPQGSASILKETLPWRAQYASFSGTLPAISSATVNIIGLAIQIREPTFGITCLAASTTTNPATGRYNLNTTTGRVESVSLGGEVPTSCGANGRFSGTSSTNAALTVTLI